MHAIFPCTLDGKIFLHECTRFYRALLKTTSKYRGFIHLCKIRKLCLGVCKLARHTLLHITLKKRRPFTSPAHAAASSISIHITPALPYALYYSSAAGYDKIAAKKPPRAFCGTAVNANAYLVISSQCSFSWRICGRLRPLSCSLLCSKCPLRICARLRRTSA